MAFILTGMVNEPASMLRQFDDDCTGIALFTSLVTSVGLLSGTVFVLAAVSAAVQCGPPPPPPPPPPQTITDPPTPQQPTTQPPPPPPAAATIVPALLDIFSIIGVVTLPANPCPVPDSAPAPGGGPCRPVLTGAGCPAGFWTLVQPTTFTSTCAPRLCDPGRIFLPSDRLCHDVREPGICPEPAAVRVRLGGSPVLGRPLLPAGRTRRRRASLRRRRRPVLRVWHAGPLRGRPAARVRRPAAGARLRGRGGAVLRPAVG